MTLVIWQCENPECSTQYAEYVNGCPKCWQLRNELRSKVVARELSTTDEWDEYIAKESLNISGYRFKWKQAKELALLNDRTDDSRLLPYWERVRLLFLELGGEYKNGGGL